MKKSRNEDSPKGPVFHFGQDEPDRLCQDRELETNELHNSNDFYGQASVLKRYAGLPDDYPLKVVLEHAPVVQDTMWGHDLYAPVPVNLSCTAKRAVEMTQHSGRPSYAIGFGYLYALRVVEREFGPAAPVERRTGTLAFPFKSTHHIITEFDHDDYANTLAELPESMQPVSICIFWKDYLRGVHKAYEKRGHRIVTAGHMYDPDFMVRLADLCRQYRYAVSNEFGTQVFLTVASGCSFSYVRSGAIKRDMPEAEKEGYVRDMPGFSSVRERSWELFDGLFSDMSADQLQFVDSKLGREYLKSPGQLKWLLRKAELCHWLAPFDRTRTEPEPGVVPAVKRRIARILTGNQV